MLLTVQNIGKAYPGESGSQHGSRAVLRDVSLVLEAGETVALTGESGSGKSTLLHLIAALDQFDSGEITLDGKAYSSLGDAGRADLRRTALALVFQQFNLVPSLTVAQNLAFHAHLSGREDPRWTRELAERLGLAELLNRYPEQLSGGQQQRVAIGRALAPRPKLLLADEPTGNLDEKASTAVLDLMLELVRETGAALFLVTHSDLIAGQLGRRLHLSGGQLS